MTQPRALPKGILPGINAGATAIGAGLGVTKSTTAVDVVALPTDGGKIWGVTLEAIPALRAAAGSCQTGGRAVAKAGAAIAARGPVQVGADGRFVTQAGGALAGHANSLAAAAGADFELDMLMGSESSAADSALYIELVLLEAALVAAATSQTLPIGTLPAGSTVLGVGFPGTFVPFTGGAISAMVGDIGSTGDVDAIRDGIGMFVAAVDGQPSGAPLGIAPNKFFATATVINLTVIATGANVDAATAGALTIRVFYTV